MNDRSSRGPALQRGALIGGIALLLLTPGLGIGASWDGETTQKVTLFTVVAEKGQEEKIPAKLKPYRTSLIIVAKRFKLSATKHETLSKGKTTKVTLPDKLGEVRIIDHGKTRSIEIVRDKKSILTAKSNRYPIILVDPKLKVGGQQVVLILDKGTK